MKIFILLIATLIISNIACAETGKEFCDKYFGTATCIPARNIGHAVILVDWRYYQPTRQLAPGEAAAATNYSTSYPGTEVTVTNLDNQKQIFYGFVKNKIGIRCTESGCSEWR